MCNQCISPPLHECREAALVPGRDAGTCITNVDDHSVLWMADTGLLCIDFHAKSLTPWGSSTAFSG